MSGGGTTAERAQKIREAIKEANKLLQEAKRDLIWRIQDEQPLPGIAQDRYRQELVKAGLWKQMDERYRKHGGIPSVALVDALAETREAVHVSLMERRGVKREATLEEHAEQEGRQEAMTAWLIATEPLAGEKYFPG